MGLRPDLGWSWGRRWVLKRGQKEEGDRMVSMERMKLYRKQEFGHQEISLALSFGYGNFCLVHIVFSDFHFWMIYFGWFAGFWTRIMYENSWILSGSTYYFIYSFFFEKLKKK